MVEQQAKSGWNFLCCGWVSGYCELRPASEQQAENRTYPEEHGKHKAIKINQKFCLL